MHRVLLLGVDGATFSVLDRLMDEGVMPFLKGLTATGARADLRSTVPPLTPPAWTSLATGRSPGHHGIFDFLRRTSPGGNQVGLVTAKNVGAETLWSLAGRHGREVTVLNFPVTYPPAAVNGRLVAGWVPWRLLPHACHPGGLYDKLKAVPGFDPRELGMDMEMERRALEGADSGDPAEWVALHAARERQWLAVTRFLMREFPADLTVVIFDGADRLQHRCWRYLDPALADSRLDAAGARLRDRVLDYFRLLDDILAEVVGLADPDTTTIVASDHGFRAQTGTFFVNTWLERHGHLRWRDPETPASRTGDARALGMPETGHHLSLLDWGRTAAYAPTATGYGIHIARRGPGTPAGIPDGEYASFRDGLLRQLLEVVDPRTGEAVVTRVWTREEAFEGPFMELAPDLTLELKDGGLPSIAPSTEVYLPRAEPFGTHSPVGIFIARGPAVRQGIRLGPLSILDVAPLVLRLLGLEVPDDMEGGVPAEALDPGALEAVAPHEDGTPPVGSPDAPPLDSEAERAVIERLRGLGYLG